jgi:hypothetical protein
VCSPRAGTALVGTARRPETKDDKDSKDFNDEER